VAGTVRSIYAGGAALKRLMRKFIGELRKIFLRGGERGRDQSATGRDYNLFYEID
jgi:hypothetical protein